MTPPIGSIQTIKADISQFLRVAEERHRRGEDTFRVVQGLADGIDAILRQLFVQTLDKEQSRVALVAVGGYGRRELCPHSDIDLLFLRDRAGPDTGIERLVRLLWDGGFQLGHSVRTPAECWQYMLEDHVTAAALLEHRWIAGSRTLYDRFLGTAVNRYRKKRGEAFVRAKLDELRESLYGRDRTIYVLEPHLKEGTCGLRDIQRVLWVENIRKGRASFEALASGGDFEVEDVRALREAYAFFLRLRCELHFTNRIKQDILERDSLVEVARGAGYQGEPVSAVETLLADYYRHALDVSHFLRHWVETKTRGKRYFAKLSRKLFARRPRPWLLAAEGTLFPDGILPQEVDEEGLVDIFLLAQSEDLRLSESLSRAVRRRAEELDADLVHNPVATECFLEVIRRGKDVCRILKAMHRSGILGRFIPEFEPLRGLVTFDGHHQFTVDEHSLRALGELDRLVAGDEDTPEEFRALARDIGDLCALRMALLLHDLGKAFPATDHSVSGSEVAILASERLGLDEELVDTIEFLVYRHLAMFDLSDRRDFTEDRAIERFAHVVESEARLDMLYLMTYLDITSVGPGTWTRWKGAQLAELWERTRAWLRSEEPGRGPGLRKIPDSSRLPEADRDAVLDHCRKVDHPTYEREVVPERMLSHVRLVRDLESTGATQVGCESFGGWYEVTFVARDRPHLFADFAGVLYSEGFNLLGARIWSRTDGVVIDVFWVEVADGLRIGMEQRLDQVRGKIQKLERREVAVEDLIRRWARSYRFRKMASSSIALGAPRVSFDNETSSTCTVIDVVARDRPGLLYDLASAISRLGLDVRSAKVSTLADRARDAFYVVEADRGKVTNPARRKEIEHLLGAEAERPTTALAEGGLYG